MRRIALAAVLCVVAFATNAGSNKWRLQVSGGAEAGGTIAFTIALDDGQRLPVSVEIAEGTGENAIAKKVRDAVRAQADACCHAEVDDGEDVLVKKKRGQPSLDIVDIQVGVKGVRITRDRE
jgi:phage tail sheath gpL-like